MTLIHRFTHKPPLLSGAAGSAQVLPGGKQFVGWGALPVFTEFTASSGFETTIALRSRPRYVAVQALGRGQKVLGVSPPRRV